MSKRSSGRIQVDRGSGNVFADIGLKDPRGLQVRAELTRQISNQIHLLGLNQTQAGLCLGIGQPDVSKLMNGRYTRFSVERLIVFLCALAADVEIVVRTGIRQKGPGRISVQTKAA